MVIVTPMGSIIVRRSHVGISKPERAYPGPASDEQMEVAARAAKITKARWDIEKTKKAAKAAKLKGSKAAKVARLKANGPARSIKPAKPKPKQLSKEVALREPRASVPARKLGISDVEFERRLKAIRQWKATQD